MESDGNLFDFDPDDVRSVVELTDDLPLPESAEDLTPEAVEPVVPEVVSPAATAVSQKLAPGGGGGGCWLGGPKTASSEKFARKPTAAETASLDGGLTWGTSFDPYRDKKPKDDDFALFGRNLFGEEIQQVPGGKLAERFTLPPFSVFDARQGVWQDRKRAWLSLGIQSELGRGGGTFVESETGGQSDRKQAYKKGSHLPTLGSVAEVFGQDADGNFNGWVRGRDASPGGSPRPACDYRNRERGDGAGNPIKDAARTFGQDLMRGEHVVGGDPGAGQPSSGTSIFDPVLCEIVYRWFCPPQGAILDPFAGGSVRGIVAAKLGFQYLGIDLRPEQLAANRDQADRICTTDQQRPIWFEGDSTNARHLADGMAFDFVFSCPPYADLEVYSDDPRDLSTMGYDAFAQAYRAIIVAALSLLKPDRFACFVVGDVRDGKGMYRGLPELTVEAFRSAGAAKYNEAILLTAVGSLPIRVGKQFAAGRKLGKTHQNVLLFCKGDPRAAAEACNGQLDLPVVVA